MPAELAWTRELPTKPGLYVWRAAPMRFEHAWRAIEEEDGSLTLMGFGAAKSWASGGQWLGPLPE